MKPQRIRRSRAKGWRMPPNTIYVGRPTVWGNPFPVRPADGSPEYGIVIPAVTIEQSVELHRARLVDSLWLNDRVLEPLRGKHLACWCAIGAPCHGDTLLEFANLAGPALTNRLLECRSAA